MKEINNVERHSVAYPVHRLSPCPRRAVYSGSRHGRVPPRDGRSTRNRRLENFPQTPAGSVVARGLASTQKHNGHRPDCRRLATSCRYAPRISNVARSIREIPALRRRLTATRNCPSLRTPPLPSRAPTNAGPVRRPGPC